MAILSVHFDLPSDFDARSLEERGRIILHHLFNLRTTDRHFEHLHMVQAEFRGEGDSPTDCGWGFTGNREEDDGDGKMHLVSVFYNVTLTNSTAEHLDTFVWDLCAHHHDGWENEDGGHGTVDFDLLERSCKLELWERHVESTLSGEHYVFNDDAESTLNQVTPEVK